MTTSNTAGPSPPSPKFCRTAALSRPASSSPQSPLMSPSTSPSLLAVAASLFSLYVRPSMISPYAPVSGSCRMKLLYLRDKSE